MEQHSKDFGEIVWAVANTNFGVQFKGYAWCKECKSFVPRNEVRVVK